MIATANRKGVLLFSLSECNFQRCWHADKKSRASPGFLSTLVKCAKVFSVSPWRALWAVPLMLLVALPARRAMKRYQAWPR